MSTDIKDFIGVFDNEDIDDFCDNIIQMFEIAGSQNAVINRQQEDPTTLKTIKDDLLIFAEDFSNGREIESFFYSKFWDIWYKKYADKYAILNSLNRHVGYSFKIQKTEPGQGYHIWHAETESLATSDRLLTWILYLNDVEEGGETEFLYQHRRVKPKKGRVVVWPAAFTHTHRGNPPLTGVKYIATGWVVFDKNLPDGTNPS